jgi:hypothetical protein
MKKSALLAACVCAVLASCDRDQSTTEVPETAPVPSSEAVETRPPAAIPVTEPEDFKVAEEEPGTAGEVIIVEPTPAPTPGQRLDHAIEKTDEGLRKAAEKTGGALRRVGEAIEQKADEQSR